MLSDFLEVSQWILLTLHDSGHSTQGGPLELLASVERVTEFKQAAVVFCDLRHEVPGGVELAESELVVVLVV